jgi:inner membrane protein
MVPDVDVIGFRFGVHYGDFWGHRGFTHSLLFAFVLTSIVAIAAVFRQDVPVVSRWPLTVYLFIASASHGVLDAMTDGGLGVAFFSLFDNRRYFFPWRPVRVSPIGITRFFSARGFAVLQSEFIWIWIPAAVFVIGALLTRMRTAKGWGSWRPG